MRWAAGGTAEVEERERGGRGWHEDGAGRVAVQKEWFEPWGEAVGGRAVLLCVGGVVEGVKDYVCVLFDIAPAFTQI